MERPLPFIATRRLILALLALAVPAALVAAPSNPAETPAKPSLKGQLLIATPAMRDPRFDHAVILMVRHDRDGAMGIVINRPLGEKPLAELLAAFGAKDTAAAGNVRIFLGGPVQLEAGFVVHSTDYRRPETIDVDARFAASGRQGDFANDFAGLDPRRVVQSAGIVQVQDEIILLQQSSRAIGHHHHAPRRGERRDVGDLPVMLPFGIEKCLQRICRERGAGSRERGG